MTQMLQTSTYVCDIEYYKVTTHTVALSLRFWLVQKIWYLHDRKTESSTFYWSLNIVIIIAILHWL